VKLTIYHNPRCSKSRQALSILEGAGIDVSIVEYLKLPPTAARLLELAKMLGMPLADLLRRGEDDFKHAADLPPLDADAALADWLESHPRVIERPIVVDDERGRAVVGRPSENVRSLLPQ